MAGPKQTGPTGLSRRRRLRPLITVAPFPGDSSEIEQDRRIVAFFLRHRKMDARASALGLEQIQSLRAVHHPIIAKHAEPGQVEALDDIRLLAIGGCVEPEYSSMFFR